MLNRIIVKNIFTVAALMLALKANAQITKVQFINNCPDVGNHNLDIWINGTKIQNALPFRHATFFQTINISTPTQIGIAPQNSTAITDTFYNRTVTFTPSSTYYIVVINGTRNSAGYTPHKKLAVDVISGARETSGVGGNVDILCANGATDGVTYDFRTGTEILGDDVSYGTAGNSYSSFSPNDIKIRLTNTNGSIRYDTYEVPLSSPSLASQACVILASGFVNPSANNNGPSFGLWLATGNGGPLTELTSTTPEAIARVQFIHNCADTTADTVDVYVNNSKVLDDFRFRHASAFMDMIGKQATNIAIAPRNSTSAAAAFYTTNFTFDSLGTHILTANGIQSATGYTPKPVFKLTKFDNGKEVAATTTNHDILFCNGSTDAGDLTINSTSVNFTNVAYDTYAGYQQQSITGTNIMTLKKGTNTVAAFVSNFPAQAEAVTVVASGFDDSTKNSKGPKLHLYYATAAGGAMTKIPLYTISVNEIARLNTPKIYPNPANDKLWIESNKPFSNIAIRNVVGKLTENISVTNGKMIDISKLPAGTYFIEAVIDNQTHTQRFIKQ